jgi:outer membrane cobalamin receptor
MTCSTFPRAWAGLLIVAGLSAPLPSLAAERQTYLIQRADLSKVLVLIATQSGREIFFSPLDTRGRQAGPILGATTVQGALAMALENTGLIFRIVDAQLIVIEPAPRGPGDLAGVPAAGADFDGPIRTVAPVAVAPEPVVALPMGRVELSNMADFGVSFLEDIEKSNATLTVSPTGAGQYRLALRGAYGAGEATVPVVFDGIPISGPAGASSDASAITADIGMVDIARTEVFKGPQGTDRGAAGMSGQLNVTTVRPILGQRQSSLGVWGIATRFGGAGLTAEALVNMPVGDRAAWRLVLYDQNRPGYVDNIALDRRDLNSQQNRGARLSGVIAPTDSFQASVMLLTQSRKLKDSSAWDGQLGDYETNRVLVAPNEQQLNLANLSWSFQPAETTFSSRTSAYSWRLDRRFDFTPVLLSQSTDPAGCGRLFGLAATGVCEPQQMAVFRDYVVARTPTLLYQPTTIRTLIEEFKIANTTGARLRYVIGLYYERRWERSSSQVINTKAGAIDEDVQRRFVGLRSIRSDFQQAALFSEASALSGAGRTVAGLRVSVVSRSGSSDVIVPNLVSGSVTSAARRRIENMGVNALLRQETALGPNKLKLQVSRGWRPGGVNTAPVLGPAQETFKPDWNENLEAGYRRAFLDGRAILDVTAYRTRWRHMQYRATTDNGSFAYVTNIGSAVINGLETEASLRLSKGLELGLQGVFTDATLRGEAAERVLVGGALSGDRLPSVPRVRLLASLRYDWTVAPTVEGSASLRTVFRSAATSEFQAADPHFRRAPSYQTVDLSFALTSGDWTTSVNVQNLFDALAVEREISNAYGAYQVTSVAPRTFTAGLKRSF